MCVLGNGDCLDSLELYFPSVLFIYTVCQMLTYNYAWKYNFQRLNQKFQDLLSFIKTFKILPTTPIHLVTFL